MIGSQALVDHVAEAGPADRQPHRVRHPRRRRRRRRPRRASTTTSCGSPTQAVLRGAELIGASRDRTSRCPTACGRAPAPSSPRSRPPRAARPTRSSASPSRPCTTAARDRLGDGPHARRRRPARRRRAGARARRARLRARAHRRHRPRAGRRRPARPHPRRRLARGAAADVRRAGIDAPQALLDEGLPPAARPARGPRGRAPRGHRPRQAAHGRGAPDRADLQGPPDRVRAARITINADGAVIDAYVVTSDPTGSPPGCARKGSRSDAPRLPDRQPARRRRPRARSCCPRVEAALRGARAARSASSARTRSSTRASWRARRARRRRDRRRDGRRRARRRGRRRAARRPTGALGVLPGGRGNDFARKLGIPRDPVGGLRRCSRTARERAVDLGRGRRRAPSSASPQRGLRLRRQPDRATTTRAASSASSSTSTATLRALARGGRRAGRSRSTASRARSRGYSRRRRRTPACSAAGCSSRPTPRSTTACSTSC